MKESIIAKVIRFHGLKVFSYTWSIKITCGCMVLTKIKKCDGSYHLMKNIVVNGIPLTLMES